MAQETVQTHPAKFCEGCYFARDCSPIGNVALFEALVDTRYGLPSGVRVWWKDEAGKESNHLDILAKPRDGVAFTDKELEFASRLGAHMINTCSSELRPGGEPGVAPTERMYGVDVDVRVAFGLPGHMAYEVRAGTLDLPENIKVGDAIPYVQPDVPLVLRMRPLPKQRGAV